MVDKALLHQAVEVHLISDSFLLIFTPNMILATQKRFKHSRNERARLKYLDKQRLMFYLRENKGLMTCLPNRGQTRANIIY